MSSANIENTVGSRAEDLACQHLRKLGLTCLARNHRCRYGELDLVMLDDNHGQQILVFVEVRLRSNPRFGDAGSSVTRSKQAKLALAARHFLHTHRQYQKLPSRFDVVAISSRNAEPPVTWIPNAFTVD